MKILVMYVDEFGYSPALKNLDTAEDVTEGNTFTDSILAFIHIEKEDEEYDIRSREKKLVNHLKWTARKNDCKKIILHSFAHLSDSKASVEFTMEIFDLAEVRLRNGGYSTAQTPFGYFLDLQIKAPGHSLARIWASL
jgi:predicted deacetylase